MANNRLSVIPNTFLRNIPNLEELILDNNLIETIVLEVRKTHFGLDQTKKICKMKKVYNEQLIAALIF